MANLPEPDAYAIRKALSNIWTFCMNRPKSRQGITEWHGLYTEKQMREYQKMNEWRPIETAPPGIICDLWVTNGKKSSRKTDCWIDDNRRCKTFGKWVCSGITEMGWYDICEVVGTPTHWIKINPPMESV